MELADLDDPDSQPGLVITRSRPSPSLYWRAVRDVVSLEEVEPFISEADFHFAPKGSRGLIGALAAVSWRPRDRTYEVLAYRMKELWGTPRTVREKDVMALDHRFPSTFNNYDTQSRHIAVTPNSPCPVLLGIRGDVPEDLPTAFSTVECEPADRWLLFETNQGTDEHLVPRKVSQLRPHVSGVVEGSVISRPKAHRGGHVIFSLGDGGVVDCVAYEPSKGFRNVVSALRQGDRVRAYGSVREFPRSVNLEKLEVLRLASTLEKVANPVCRSCRKRMKSAGLGAGFRCRKCGARAPLDAAEVRPISREVREGIYEPPVGARRHISKPIKRMLRSAR